MTISRQPETPFIGISIGDLNGIGPEVIIKTLSDNRILNMLTPVIFGSSRVLSFYKKLLNANDFNYSQAKDKNQFTPKSINVVNCWEEMIEIQPGVASKESGHASFLALNEGANQLKDGSIQALVTAPIDKNSIHSEEFPYKGHTDFLTDFFGISDSLMLMVSDTLRVGLVTEHISIREISSVITRDLVERKMQLLEKTLIEDFDIQKPRIAVLGLNPHAGDGGVIGKEDGAILKPLVDDLKNKGKLVYGPLPADGFFSGAYRKYDGVLAMYHDQGLIPFKAIAFSSGVNYTAGLPVVRTSPDHGTAYDIAGKNIADERSFREALFLALEISRKRISD